MSAAAAERATISEHEVEQIARANASTSTPVVFVHGLWLLPSSWDRWAALGYAVPRAGEPVFEAAAANLNPWSEAKVDTKNPERGPKNRGHALTVDAGCREVAETALDFVERFA
jgi:hypothetical protein